MSIDLDHLYDHAVSASPTQLPTMEAVVRRVRQRRRRRLAAAVTVLIPLAGLAAIATWSVMKDRDAVQVIAAGDNSAPPDQATAPGGFVWPFPGQDFSSLDALVSGFVTDLLGWPPDNLRQAGGTGGRNEPQSVTLTNLSLGREIHLLAVPSDAGWGFVQIGNPMRIDETQPGGFAVRFEQPPGAVSTTVKFHLDDGSTLSESVDDNSLRLPDQLDPLRLVSILAVSFDEYGNAIAVSGSQFSPSTGTITTMPATQDNLVKVPDLVGLPVAKAIKTLESAGLEAQIDGESDPGLATTPGIITRIDPDPGSLVPAGATVTLTLAPRKSALATFDVGGLTVQVITPLDELPQQATTVAVIPSIVIDTGTGPRACLTGARLSLPPQCSGPKLIGLDIDTLPGVEARNGTRWIEDGGTRFVGRWDGTDITLTLLPEAVTDSQPTTDEPPPPPTGYSDDQLKTIQTQVSAVLEDSPGGNSHIFGGWVVVSTGVVDRSVAARFLAAVDDPTPILLVGQAEILE